MDKSFFLNTKLTDDQIGLFYLGQEGFLIKYQETYILIDPYLSDYVDQNCCTDLVKWVRRYPAPISAQEFDFVDYVLCTHAHYDHADPETLSILAKINPKAKFIAPLPIKDTMLSYGIALERFIGALADEAIIFDKCRIVPIPSAHEELTLDANGHYVDMGYRIYFDDFSIYHAGDCCIYEGLKERLMNVDVLMVPVNGRSYYKRYIEDIIGNMTCEESIILAKETKAKMMVPMHYDLYDCNRINPAEFVDCLFSMNPSQKFHMFAPGELYIIQK